MWPFTTPTFFYPLALSLILSKAAQSATISRLKEHKSPSLWKRSEVPLNKTDQVTFRFALTQTHMEEVHELVMKISDPNSADYGKFWTPQQIAEYFAPSPESKKTVENWLLESGVDQSNIKMSQSKGFLETRISISHAERLMKADYNHYVHKHTGALTVGTASYELPDDIAKHVDFVSPGTTLATPLKFGHGGAHSKKIGGHIVPVVSKTLELSVAAVSDTGEGLGSVLYPPGTNGLPLIASNQTVPSSEVPNVLHGVCALRKNRTTRGQSINGTNNRPLSNGTRATRGPPQSNSTVPLPTGPQPGFNLTNLTSSHNASNPNQSSNNSTSSQLGTQHGLNVTSSNSSVSCGTQMSPQCLKQLYKFDTYVQKATEKNSFGVIEITPQTAILDDFDLFFKKFAPEAVGSLPEVVSIDGGKLNSGLRITQYVSESNLDIQYAMALTHPLKVQLLQMGDVVQEAGINNFLDAVDAAHCQIPLTDNIDGIYPDPQGYNKRDCGTIKSPNVVSLSYGHNEMEAPPDFLFRQCQEFAKLGMMGITLLSASGDFGVAGHWNLCMTESGEESPNGTVFNPTWPSACPYITSVGATQLPVGASLSTPESACYNHISSAGGFSNVFPTPAYQKNALAQYFANYKPPYTAKQYNNSQNSRGYPDLSANGAAFVPVVNGRISVTYGTSASAPTVAALLSMINDARLAINKTPIGFINPAIYSDQFRAAFTDITNGTNPGCHSDGFKAVPGWDPLTGLGTPDFSKLLPLWLALP